MDNPSRTVRRAAAITSAAYAAVLYLAGITLDSEVKQLLNYVPSLLAFGVIAFDLWYLKIPWIHRFGGPPRLYGAWRGTLTPRPESKIPEGGSRGPIDVALIIEQTFWSISTRLLTVESSSISTTASIRKPSNRSSQRILAYAYANTPSGPSSSRSSRHVGAAELEIVGSRPVSITGIYWTDRFTVGDMNLVLIDTNTDYGTVAQVPTNPID